MKSKFAHRSAFLAFLIAFSALLTRAQLPTGTINGRVTDPGNAVVTNAPVVATNQSTNVARETVTNSDGLYVFSELAPGSYRVAIKASGFAVSEFKDVLLQAGRATTVDAELKVASVGSTVTVGGTSNSVELTQSMIQGQITSGTIENIPLNGRNFLELAYLIPGNRPAPNFDPTKTNTLEVSSDGSIGRGGNITVDGGDNNDEVVGGTLSNFPQDAIQEFQIATARFTAEAGRSGSSIINIITKSGSNEYHGSLFDYERNRHLQALPATFDRDLPTPPFDREQFGGSIGGPLKSNKAWWFASAEYRNQNAAIPTGTRDFATDTILNTVAPAPLRDALFSTRFDYQFDPTNSLMARYSFNRSTDTAAASAASVTPLLSGTERQNSLNRFNSFVAGWTKTVSPTKVNNLLFHYDTFLNKFPNSPTACPPPIPTSA